MAPHAGAFTAPPHGAVAAVTATPAPRAPAMRLSAPVGELALPTVPRVAHVPAPGTHCTTVPALRKARPRFPSPGLSPATITTETPMRTPTRTRPGAWPSLAPDTTVLPHACARMSCRCAHPTFTRVPTSRPRPSPRTRCAGLLPVATQRWRTNVPQPLDTGHAGWCRRHAVQPGALRAASPAVCEWTKHHIRAPAECWHPRQAHCRASASQLTHRRRAQAHIRSDRAAAPQGVLGCPTDVMCRARSPAAPWCSFARHCSPQPACASLPCAPRVLGVRIPQPRSPANAPATTMPILTIPRSDTGVTAHTTHCTACRPGARLCTEWAWERGRPAIMVVVARGEAALAALAVNEVRHPSRHDYHHPSRVGARRWWNHIGGWRKGDAASACGPTRQEMQRRGREDKEGARESKLGTVMT